MIRLCPLPYSLSNGAISTFPSVHPLMFALATAIVTPKLIIHVFIGERLAAIAKSGEKMSSGTKAVNWMSIIFGMVFGVVTGWYIYRRTTARARELEAAEEEAVAGRGRQRRLPSFPSSVRRFSDERDTATLLEDDRIDFLDQEGDGYKDDFADDDATVLKVGMRDEEDAIVLDDQLPARR